MSDLSSTQFFQVEPGPQISAKDIFEIVYKALKEKGYNPVNQIVGYIMSGDPTYITSFNGARSIMRGNNQTMRVMGLDYGTKTVGVAISDPLGLTAQGIETIQRKEENKLRRTCARIEELIKEYQVEKIVLGFPKHMNNDIGERAQKSLEFRDMLVRRTGLEVIMWDERLTTVEANRTLMEASVRRENRKQYLDQLAAVFILQGYLDAAAHKKEQQEESES